MNNTETVPFRGTGYKITTKSEILFKPKSQHSNSSYSQSSRLPLRMVWRWYFRHHSSPNPHPLPLKTPPPPPPPPPHTTPTATPTTTPSSSSVALRVTANLSCLSDLIRFGAHFPFVCYPHHTVVLWQENKLIKAKESSRHTTEHHCSGVDGREGCVEEWGGGGGAGRRGRREREGERERERERGIYIHRKCMARGRNVGDVF